MNKLDINRMKEAANYLVGVEIFQLLGLLVVGPKVP